MEFFTDPSSFGIKTFLISQSTIEYISHLGTKDFIILLMHKQYLDIFEWKLDSAVMICKESSDAHLFNRDIIDFGEKQ